MSLFSLSHLEVWVMSCTHRLFGRLLPFLAIIAMLAMIPNALSGGGAFTGDYAAGSASWNMVTGGTVGNTLDGTVAVDSGSILFSRSGIIASGSGSNGTATVTGARSMWFNAVSLTVGNNGNNAELWVTGGGSVYDNTGYIASAPGGPYAKATVNGAGSSWTNSSTLSVAYGGVADLFITNGGRVTNTTGYIGDSPTGVSTSSDGIVTVDGIGSTWTNTADLYVGHVGFHGALAISNGGAVSTAGTTYVSQPSTAGALASPARAMER